MDNLTPTDEAKGVEKLQGQVKDTFVEDNYNPDGTPKEPFKLPEKFEGKSAEDIAKAYMELEKLHSAQQQQSGEPVPSKEPPKDEGEPSTETKTQITNADFQKYEEAYRLDGKLTEEHYTELATKYNLSKEVVDSYINTLKYKVEALDNAIYNSVGGKEAYTEIINWASGNLDQKTAEGINEIIKSGNVDRIKYELENLKLRMGNSETRRIEGDGAGSNSRYAPFNTLQEYYTEVRKPEYSTNAKFRDMVDARFIAGKSKGNY